MIDTYGVLILSHMVLSLPLIVWIMVGVFQRFASGTGGGGHCGRLYQTEML